MRNLDEIDVKILNMLKKNARTPLKELSAEVFLTTPAVSSRMEKLEREDVYKRQVMAFVSRKAWTA